MNNASDIATSTPSDTPPSDTSSELVLSELEPQQEDVTPEKEAGTPETTMSYARARLYLGISCVGMWVVLSSVALLFRLPARIVSTSTAWSLTDVTQLLTVVLVYAALQGAFDLFGGFVLPKEYGRYTPRLGAFLLHWFRGAALHGVFLTLVGLALLVAARIGGGVLALLIFLLITGGLIATQLGLARLVGGLGLQHQENTEGQGDTEGSVEGNVALLRAPFPHLTGGVAGLLGGTVVVPEAWRERFDPETFALLVKRKQMLMERGSRRLGLTFAFYWNVVGFILAYIFAGGTASVAGLVSFALWSTLWAFVGVLVLPSRSRRAVFQGDALAAPSGQEARLLIDALTELDRDQDDEYRRGQAVETIFHPIPAVARRIERLETRDAPPRFTTWHVARTALYLSWANLSLLSRAVHCNIGRPEVWVFLPSD